MFRKREPKSYIRCNGFLLLLRSLMRWGLWWTEICDEVRSLIKWGLWWTEVWLVIKWGLRWIEVFSVMKWAQWVMNWCLKWSEVSDEASSVMKWVQVYCEVETTFSFVIDSQNLSRSLLTIKEIVFHAHPKLQILFWNYHFFSDFFDEYNVKQNPYNFHQKKMEVSFEMKMKRNQAPLGRHESILNVSYAIGIWWFTMAQWSEYFSCLFLENTISDPWFESVNLHQYHNSRFYICCKYF